MYLEGVQLPEKHIPPVPARDPNPFKADPAFPFLQQAAMSKPPAEALPPASHTVAKGDNLTRIVRDYLKAAGETPANAALYKAVADVAAANKLRDADVIHPGQTLDLRVLQPKPAQVAEAPVPAPALEELPWARIAAKRKANPPAAEIATGEQRHFQEARAAIVPEGARPVKLEPAKGGPAHQLLDPPPMLRFQPVVKEKSPDLPRADLGVLMDEILNAQHPPQAQAAAGEDAWPLGNPWAKTLSGPGRLTSEFGIRPDPFTGRNSFHDGIDVAAAAGTIIYPVRPGVVTFSGWKGGYGRMIVVKHEDGIESVYGHNAMNAVKVGQQVTEKTPLGQVGSTGRSTGPHLHFEIRQNGVPVNPVAFLQQESMLAEND